MFLKGLHNEVTKIKSQYEEWDDKLGVVVESQLRLKTEIPSFEK